MSRGGYYYEPCPESAENLALMRRIDELHMQHPVYGRTRLTAVLRREGLPVNEKRIGRLMRVMGLEAIYCKPAAKGRNMPNSAAMLKTLSSSAFNDTI